MTQAEHWYVVAAVIFITSCLIAAAIRWLHTCPHPKELHDVYYPDRKMGASFFMVPVVLLPYVFHPSDPDAWLLIRCYFPVTYFFYMGTLLFLFFGSFKQRTRWKPVGYAMACVSAATLLLLFVIASWPGLQLSEIENRIFEWFAIGVGVLTTGWCVVALWIVEQWIRDISDESYSNPDDIPKSYAKQSVTIPYFMGVIVWVVFFLNNQSVQAVYHVAQAVFNTLFLVFVLRPRAMDNFMDSVIASMLESSLVPERGQVDSAEPVQPSKDPGTGLSPKVADEIAAQIEAFVYEGKGYLDAHLKIEDVVAHCSYSRAYVSRVFRERFGGFSAYVNGLRLDYYEEYMRTHPHATKDAAAQESGFSSYQ